MFNMQEYLQPALEGLLYTFGAFIAGYLITLLHKYVGTANMKKIQQEIETHQDLAKLVIMGVQQIYSSLQGSEKLALATKQLSDLLVSKGIKMSADQINLLIESTLKGLKQEFMQTWHDEIKQDLQPVDPTPTPVQPVVPVTPITPDSVPIPQTQEQTTNGTIQGNVTIQATVQ
jgi:hypothetical protein